MVQHPPWDLFSKVWLKGREEKPGLQVALLFHSLGGTLIKVLWRERHPGTLRTVGGHILIMHQHQDSQRSQMTFIFSVFGGVITCYYHCFMQTTETLINYVTQCVCLCLFTVETAGPVLNVSLLHLKMQLFRTFSFLMAAAGFKAARWGQCCCGQNEFLQSHILLLAHHKLFADHFILWLL